VVEVRFAFEGFFAGFAARVSCATSGAVAASCVALADAPLAAFFAAALARLAALFFGLGAVGSWEPTCAALGFLVDFRSAPAPLAARALTGGVKAGTVGGSFEGWASAVAVGAVEAVVEVVAVLEVFLDFMAGFSCAPHHAASSACTLCLARTARPVLRISRTVSQIASPHEGAAAPTLTCPSRSRGSGWATGGSGSSPSGAAGKSPLLEAATGADRAGARSHSSENGTGAISDQMGLAHSSRNATCRETDTASDTPAPNDARIITLTLDVHYCEFCHSATTETNPQKPYSIAQDRQQRPASALPDEREREELDQQADKRNNDTGVNCGLVLYPVRLPLREQESPKELLGSAQIK
jgi:hypothetical protein